MYYRFKLSFTGEGDSAETAFTQWREEQSEADKIAEINKLRAANPDGVISIERSQAKPEDDSPR